MVLYPKYMKLRGSNNNINNHIIKKLFIFSTFLLAILLFSSSNSFAFTIGSDTGKIFFSNVLRAGYAAHKITLSTDSDTELLISPLIVGEASSWIKIEPENITLKVGQPVVVKVIVTPPDDVANGNYTATLSFLVQPQANQTTRMGSKIVTSINIPITIEITGTEIKSCDASSFIIPDVEQGNEPIVRVRILNTGNVRVKPSLNIRIMDRDIKKVLFEDTIKADNELLPTEEDTFFFTIPRTFNIGQYWAFMEIVECGSRGETTFDVVEVGGLTDEGEFMRIDYKGELRVNNIIELYAVFKNIGYREVTASFQGVIEKDGNIVRVIDTPSLSVAPGEVAYIPFYFKPTSSGEYIIRGRVRFNNKLTYEKSLTLNISGEKEQPNLGILLLIIALALLIVGIIRKKYSRRRRFRF